MTACAQFFKATTVPLRLQAILQCSSRWRSTRGLWRWEDRRPAHIDLVALGDQVNCLACQRDPRLVHENRRYRVVSRADLQRDAQSACSGHQPGAVELDTATKQALRNRRRLDPRACL